MWGTGKYEHTLTAVATADGHVALEVFVIGGVTKAGKALEADAFQRAYPSEAVAKKIAKRLGPRVWVARALLPCGRVVRWQTK